MPGSCVRTVCTSRQKESRAPGNLIRANREAAHTGGRLLPRFSHTSPVSPHSPRFQQTRVLSNPALSSPTAPTALLHTAPPLMPWSHSPTSSYLNHSPQPLHHPDSWQPHLRWLLPGPLPVSASPGPSFLLPWLRLQSQPPRPTVTSALLWSPGTHPHGQTLYIRVILFGYAKGKH